MNKQFVYENIVFDYCLMLEDRKTIAATVFPTQALMVKAPMQATDDRIYGFLKRKFRWILKQKRYFAQFASRSGRKYVSGETFRYLGRSYKLLVRKNGKMDRVSLQHGTLTVYSRSPGDRNRSRELLDEWYLKRALTIFPERLSACFALSGYKKMPALRIRSLKRRWGSYSYRTNRIALNRDLIRASKRHIDYVIVHELCHMIHRKHSRAFYDLLESKLPEWEKRKTELELSLLG